MNMHDVPVGVRTCHLIAVQTNTHELSAGPHEA
jgi:hypothetical protein